MSQPFFRYVPDFEYVSRLPDAKISEYIQVKNLFKRVKLSDEIFQDLAYFTKYKILPNQRPDNVAYNVYDDKNLDWLVMLCNNIINLTTEWPLSQEDLLDYMLNKYGSEENFFNVHHYETVEVRDSRDSVVMRSGFEVSQNFSVTYFDSGLNSTITQNNVTKAVLNIDYENQQQDNKSNIFVLKQEYVQKAMDDLTELMKYFPGSSQYINRNISNSNPDPILRGENIRLYQN